MHAILSPSASSRWLQCTPSARLEQTIKDKSSSAAADEGTLAHTLGDLLIRKKLGRVSKAFYKSELVSIKGNKYYSESMMEHMQNYATYVLEKFSSAQLHTPHAEIYTEKNLILDEYIPESFGTGDAGIVSNPLAEIVDLKYGMGVLVEAEHNTQMMIYALGMYEAYKDKFKMQRIRMTIYQPRMDNISTFEISKEDLLEWAENYLKKRALRAWKGTGVYSPGKHCQFCKAKHSCRALAEMNLRLASYDNRVLLDDDETTDVLSKAEGFISWISAVKQHALSEALKGKRWPGYKLVESQSRRTYTDENLVGLELEFEDYDEELIYKKEVRNITDLEKKLGKKKFTEILGHLIIKPKGSPTLVPLSDKRKPYSVNDSARNDFKDDYEF